MGPITRRNHAHRCTNLTLPQEDITMVEWWQMTHCCNKLHLQFRGAACKVLQKRTISRPRGQTPSVWYCLTMLVKHNHLRTKLLTDARTAINHSMSQGPWSRAGGSDKPTICSVASVQTSIHRIFGFELDHAPTKCRQLYIYNIILHGVGLLPLWWYS